MKPILSLTEIKTLLIVILLAISGMLGTDIHLASLPSIMEYMHTDKQHMQQSVAIFLLGMGLSLLIYGPLSDKYGRRPIVIIGLAIAVLFSFAAIFTSNIHTFLLTRFLQGVGSGVCMGLGRTIIADVLHGERLATIGSYFAMFTSLSSIFAPAIGGYLQHWFNWQANFIALGLFLGITLILYLLFCPETNYHKNPNACSVKGLYESYKELLLHPIFVGCTLLTGIASAAAMVYATTSSFILQGQFHLSVIQYGWVTSIIGAGNLLGKFICPWIIRRINAENTMQSGIWLLVSSGCIVLLAIVLKPIILILLIIGVFITTFAQAFIMPVAAAKALSPFHDKRGAAGALYGSFQMLVAFISSAVVGGLAVEGMSLLGVCFLILGLLALWVYFKLVH